MNFTQTNSQIMILKKLRIKNVIPFHFTQNNFQGMNFVVISCESVPSLFFLFIINPFKEKNFVLTILFCFIFVALSFLNFLLSFKHISLPSPFHTLVAFIFVGCWYLDYFCFLHLCFSFSLVILLLSCVCCFAFGSWQITLFSLQFWCFLKGCSDLWYTKTVIQLERCFCSFVPQNPFLHKPSRFLVFF